MNKKSFTKRILAVTLSIIMVLGLLPMTVLASDVFPGKPDGMSISGSSTETINGQTVWLCPNSGGSIVKKNTGNGYAIYEAAPYGGYTFSHWATYCVAVDWWNTFESANRYDEEEGYAFSKSDSKTARYDEKDDQIRVNTSSEANYTYYVYAVFVQGVSVSISVEGGGANIHAKNLDNYISSVGQYEYYVQNAEGTVHFGVGKNSQMQVQILSGWATYFEHVYVNDVDVINTSNVYYSESGPDRRHFYVQTFTVTEPITIRAVTKQRGVNVIFYSNDVNATGTMEERFLQIYEDYNIPENQFVNEGYIFSGWNTKADGTGTSYTDKQSVRFTIADDGTELSLYAQWTKCNNHTWTNGECTKCGAICFHTGGNATCTEKATCTTCGEKYGELRKHYVSYTASLNRIVETCTVCNTHTATADIVRDENVSTVYNGSAIEALKVNYSDNWQSDDLDIVYSNNINAGTASGTISIGGATATQTFEITAANICDATVTLDPTSGEYTGNPYTPNITVTLDGFGTLVKDTHYTFSWDNDGFTAPDTYTVRVVGIDNFTGYVDKTFTINAASLTDVKVEQVGTLTYNGEALTPIVSANAVAVNNQPVIFTYSTLEDGTYGTLPSFDKAGSYTVYYKATAPNHNEATGSFTVTVDKATVTVPTIASKVYNGTVQTADVPASDLYTVVENNGGTGVKLSGYYDVVLELKDAANYKWSSTDNAQVTLQFAITRATNEWTVTPSIGGWTYGKTAKTPVGSAKFGDVSIQYTGATNDGTQFSSMTAPTQAGSYTATFIVAETEDYSGLETSVDFTIEKADQAAPTGLAKTDTTYFGKADGKISGLTSAMEFRKEGDSTYTAGFNGTLEYLAAGIYYVRYQGDANHNPSPDAVVTVNAGRKLQIVVPQNQIGYTVTVNKTEMEYEGSYTLKVEIHEGYTATEDFKIIISNWECGQQAGVEETYMNAIADQIIEVQGVADITAPAAEIKIENNKWTSLWNNLTFGLFFKETQDVTITATDKGSGVKSIEYYLAGGELELDEVLSIKEWVEYNGAFKINPNNRYVVYAKIVDNAGNTVYVNSDGIVLDDVAPTLEGIENGKTYYGDLTVIKSDEQFYDIKIVTLDGEPMGFAEGTYGLIPADNAEHTVVVEDHAGNKTTYTVTVMKNYTVTYRADGEIVSTETVGHGKDATLPAVPAKAGYTGKWDHDGKNITSDIVINAVYTENSASASPQTGDNSNMFLWIALLFISGGAIITLTVVDRKRRTVNKR